MKIGNLLILLYIYYFIGCSKDFEPNMNVIQNKNMFENKEKIGSQ